MIVLSDRWKATHANAGVGILKMRGVVNPSSDAAMEVRAKQFEHDIRTRFASADRTAIKAIPAIHAYNEFYKRFKIILCQQKRNQFFGRSNSLETYLRPPSSSWRLISKSGSWIREKSFSWSQIQATRSLLSSRASWKSRAVPGAPPRARHCADRRG